MIMELRASERSSPGSQTMNQGRKKRIAIHSPCVYPPQLLQTAASIKPGPGLLGSYSVDALPTPGGLVDMKASINRVKPADRQPLLN